MTHDQSQMLIETHTYAKQTHAAVFGNGKPGLKTEMERLRGGFAFLRGMCIFTISVSTLLIGAAGVIVAIVTKGN